MLFVIVLFMILVIIGLASIHHELRNRTKNDERIINRLDLIIKDLRNFNRNEPNK